MEAKIRIVKFALSYLKYWILQTLFCQFLCISQWCFDTVVQLCHRYSFFEDVCCCLLDFHLVSALNGWVMKINSFWQEDSFKFQIFFLEFSFLHHPNSDFQHIKPMFSAHIAQFSSADHRFQLSSQLNSSLSRLDSVDLIRWPFVPPKSKLVHLQYHFAVYSFCLCINVLSPCSNGLSVQ